MRTQLEINKKIESLIKDKDNFVSGDWDGDENYSESFSEFYTEKTLKEFADWLLEI
jgi:hypothetical protein